jgi:hypothetical protein
VDPSLAKLARASLPERPWERPETTARRRPTEARVPPPMVRMAGPLAPAEVLTASSRRWQPGRRVRLTVLGATLATVAGVLVLTSLAPIGDSPPLSAAKPNERAGAARPPALPPPPPSEGESRTLAWAPAPRAEGYEVALFRSDAQVLSVRTSKPRLTVRSTWTHRGRSFSLTAGDYRWYVWPLGRDRRKLVRRDPVVQARFAISD